MADLLFHLFLTFFKIGFIGFGGGMAILPLIYQGVTQFYYISPEEFANLFAIAQATPGPIAINAATFVGYKVAGLSGSVIATLSVALPAFILVIITVRILNRFHENPLVQGAFKGIRPVAAGMIAASTLYIAEGGLFLDTKAGTGSWIFSDFMSMLTIATPLGELNLFLLAIALVTFILQAKTKLGAIRILIIMGALGAVFCS